MTLRTAGPRIAVACCTLLLFASSLPRAADGWLMRLDLEQGKTYRFAMTQTQRIDMNLGVMGKQKGSSVNRVEVSQTVEERLPDGAVALALTYERFVVDTDMMGQKVHFDSADPAPEAESPFDAMKDMLTAEPLRVELSARGEVRQVSGFEAMWEALAGQAGEDPMARRMVETLRQGFGDDFIKSMLQQTSPVFPAGPVNPGDTWDHAAVLSNPFIGETTVRNVYQVEGLETRGDRECVKLKLETTIDFGDDFPLAEQLREVMRAQGQDVSLDVDVGQSRGTGVIWIERDTGLTADGDMHTEMSLGMNFRVKQGDQEMPMNLDMAIEQDVSIARLD